MFKITKFYCILIFKIYTSDDETWFKKKIAWLPRTFFLSYISILNTLNDNTLRPLKLWRTHFFKLSLSPQNVNYLNWVHNSFHCMRDTEKVITWSSYIGLFGSKASQPHYSICFPAGKLKVNAPIIGRKSPKNVPSTPFLPPDQGAPKQRWPAVIGGYLSGSVKLWFQKWQKKKKGGRIQWVIFWIWPSALNMSISFSWEK